MDPQAVLAYGAEQALPLTGTGRQNANNAAIFSKTKQFRASFY